jgi:hypothetical protein
MNSERRAIALALVQQTALQQAQRTIAELHEYTVLVRTKEFGDDILFIELYNNEKSWSTYVQREDIIIDKHPNPKCELYKLDSVASLFNIPCTGTSVSLMTGHDFSIGILSSDHYTVVCNGKHFSNINMHMLVLDDLCAKLHAFMNHQ